MNRHLRRAGRAAFLVGGIAIVALLVGSVGYERVGAALTDAAPSLPIIVLLEVGIGLTDLVGIKLLLGAESKLVRRSTWARAMSLAYAAGIVLPAGRAAAEATRAGTLSVDVGLARAASACSRLQTSALFGTAVASLAAAMASFGKSSLLAGLLAGNAVICTGLGFLVLSIVRWRRLGEWIRARWPKLAGEGEVAKVPGATLKASLACVGGRLIQVAQYAVALAAVGGFASVRGGMIAQGIHLLGATAGDAIPNQVGATEGAFDLFASAVGLANAPARALSIAIVIRAAQLGLAAVAFVLATFAVPKPAPG